MDERDNEIMFDLRTTTNIPLYATLYVLRNLFNKNCNLLNNRKLKEGKRMMSNGVETSETLWSALFYYCFK